MRGLPERTLGGPPKWRRPARRAVPLGETCPVPIPYAVPPTAEVADPPRMVRPAHGRVLAGVCAGLAEHLGLPVAWVRGFVAVLIYVREFLAVRALGCLMLLVSGPVLASAFLQPQLTRLLLPTLAYVWIIVGMYFIGMPYLMRDWVNWLLAKEGRYGAAIWAGVAYGAALLLLAVTTY